MDLIKHSINSTWNDSYSLNIKMIDDQHKKFFMLFDEILIANKNNEGLSVVKEFIQELENYADYHFRVEETLMKQGNHTGLDYHVAQHQIFKKKIAEFKEATKYENNVILNQMMIFMRKWFLTHIFNEDSGYVPCVQNYFSEKEKSKNKKTF